MVDPGGGGASKNNVVLKMCFVNIYMQYSHTKYGNTEYFRSHLSIVLFPFFSTWGEGTPPPCSNPARYFGSRTMSTYFLQFFSYKCVLSIFIYNIALQNADFGVLQKSFKHFLYFHFLSTWGEGDNPSLSHPLGTIL